MKPIDRHLYEIRSGGWSVVRWKILALFEYLALIICGLWAIPVLLLIRCLRPWRIIRFGPISSSRIGSFIVEVTQMWAIAHRQSKVYLDLYWLKYSPICNEFWAAMVRRNFLVSFWIRPLDQWNQILPGGAMHNGPTEFLKEFRDINGWQERTPEKMPFLAEEDAFAKSWLRQQGWQEGDPFVCLLVRDGSYLDSTFTNTDPHPYQESKYDPKIGYGWHHLDYRDSDIASYVPAAEWLADRGAWVLRMGKVMARPMPSRHPRIIDYAFHPDKSDFLDIWLFAHCDLCIGTGSGIEMVSDFYRKPLLLLNFNPLIWLVSWSNAMHLPKTLVWQATGIPLNLREQLNCTSAEDHNSIKIKNIDLSPEVILAAVQERWERFQGSWVDTEDDIKRYQQFWEILKSHPDFHKFHNWIHPESRAGAIWLRSKDDDYFN